MHNFQYTSLHPFSCCRSLTIEVRCTGKKIQLWKINLLNMCHSSICSIADDYQRMNVHKSCKRIRKDEKWKMCVMINIDIVKIFHLLGKIYFFTVVEYSNEIIAVNCCCAYKKQWDKNGGNKIIFLTSCCFTAWKIVQCNKKKSWEKNWSNKNCLCRLNRKNY